MPMPTEDPAGNDDLFSLALYARCESALMWLLVTSDDVGTEAFDRHRSNAFDAASRAGYLYPDEPQPALLQDNCEVHDAWHYGVGLREQERHEEQKTLERERRIALAAAKDWDALGYRRPEAILADLQSGEHVCVAGHELYPDGECVFFENPYNVPGIFGDLRELTVADVEHFLTDMAKGEEWGLVPH
ncbi:hypothetical protein [Paraburkholderia fungorum]|uniref:Immunity protein 22 n=1 Tax=Paraburkholderia fungorum TaxID=134537 RepID=A0AAW3UZX6_9BURK|nr:hypothetical protein [Paraburkholderia fungorum]MBB4517151.1 hypothetical protein [Paraburkholderia fungorum]MBB6204219.1 hypothetical protein [Paraburkholderia fungorum]